MRLFLLVAGLVCGAVLIGEAYLYLYPPTKVEAACIGKTPTEIYGCIRRQRWVEWFEPCCSVATLDKCTPTRFF